MTDIHTKRVQAAYQAVRDFEDAEGIGDETRAMLVLMQVVVHETLNVGHSINDVTDAILQSHEHFQDLLGGRGIINETRH